MGTCVRCPWCWRTITRSGTSSCSLYFVTHFNVKTTQGMCELLDSQNQPFISYFIKYILHIKNIKYKEWAIQSQFQHSPSGFSQTFSHVLSVRDNISILAKDFCYPKKNESYQHVVLKLCKAKPASKTAYNVLLLSITATRTQPPTSHYKSTTPVEALAGLRVLHYSHYNSISCQTA